MPPSTVFIDISRMGHHVDPVKPSSQSPSSESPLRLALKSASKMMMFRGYPSSGTLPTVNMHQEEEDYDDLTENSIIRGDEHETPLSHKYALNHVASPQTPPIPSMVFTSEADNDDDEIPISSLLLNSIDVDERRIRDLQQTQRMAQEYQRVRQRTQSRVDDGTLHDLYKSQRTPHEPVDINVRLANKLALLYREKYEPHGSAENLEYETNHQYDKDCVSSASLFPVGKLCLGFGMVMLCSRSGAWFPAAMIVWLWWVKESFF